MTAPEMTASEITAPEITANDAITGRFARTSSKESP